jgi:hypothetical protein
MVELLHTPNLLLEVGGAAVITNIEYEAIRAYEHSQLMTRILC